MELCERLHYTLYDFRRSHTSNELRTWAIRDKIRDDERAKAEKKAKLDAEVNADFEKNRGNFNRRPPSRS